MSRSRRARRANGGPDSWTKAGVIAIATAAAVTSFAALADLARVSGWRDELAPCLPVTIDLYAAVTTRVWLANSTPPKARAHARAHALTAIAISMIGNGISHVLSYGALHPGGYTWLLVVAVSLVPPAALAGVTHLAALLNHGQATPRPAPTTTAPTAPTSPSEPSHNATTEPGTEPDSAAPPAGTEQTAPPGNEAANPQLNTGAPPTEPPTGPPDHAAPGDRSGAARQSRATVPGLAERAISAAPPSRRAPHRATEPPNADHTRRRSLRTEPRLHRPRRDRAEPTRHRAAPGPRHAARLPSRAQTGRPPRRHHGRGDPHAVAQSPQCRPRALRPATRRGRPG